MLKTTCVAVLFSLASTLAMQGYAADPSIDTATVQEVQAVINLNAADVNLLQASLYGVGQSKAQAIVDYRNAHGPFATVDELLEVKGIGAATLERNRHILSVE